MLKYDLIMSVVRTLYGMVFRPLLVKAIDNPEEVWDDDILRMLDAFFGYKP